MHRSDGPPETPPPADDEHHRALRGDWTHPDDSEDDRIRKGALTVAAGIVAALTPIWVITYLVLDLPLPAAIPLTYLVISVVSLVAFWRRKRFRTFRATQLTLLLILPFALQWSLGGFMPSSGVALWALTCPLGALMFAGTRQAGPWFVAYLSLIGVSLALEPLQRPPTFPKRCRSCSSPGTSPACP